MLGMKGGGRRSRFGSRENKAPKKMSTNKARKELQKGMVKRTENVSELPERSKATSSMKSEVPLKMRKETTRECNITPEKVAKNYNKKGSR